MRQYSGPQQQGNFQFLGSQEPGFKMYGTVLPPPLLPPYTSQPQVQDPQPKKWAMNVFINQFAVLPLDVDCCTAGVLNVNSHNTQQV